MKTQIIGQFVPERLDEPEIRDGLRAWLEQRGYVLSWLEARTPAQNSAIGSADQGELYEDIKVWHRDGMSARTSTFVVWANIAPTEILYQPTRTRLNTQPFDVVLIHNQEVVHRTPRIMPDGRWFVRAPVKRVENVNAN